MEDYNDYRIKKSNRLRVKSKKVIKKLKESNSK